MPGRLEKGLSGVPAGAPDADKACDEDKEDCEARDAAEAIASGCCIGDQGSESLDMERRLGWLKAAECGLCLTVDCFALELSLVAEGEPLSFMPSKLHFLEGVFITAGAEAYPWWSPCDV